jgi:hypothetical protein
MAIMATIALMFAFPDFGDWTWWALVFIACIVWALGAGFLERQPIGGDPKATESSETANNNLDGTVSPDAAALVNAINRQERANRAQEQRDDDRRRTLEQITMIVIFVTAGAILTQVGEMRKVYKPIADQAQATKDNMVADHRAWIGPLTQAIEMPANDKPISYIMQYANSGRQPETTGSLDYVRRAKNIYA